MLINCHGLARMVDLFYTRVAFFAHPCLIMLRVLGRDNPHFLIFNQHLLVSYLLVSP